MSSLITIYLKYQSKFTKLYGDKTIVFMQVGSFYEAYGTNELGYDLLEISKLLNIIRTKKNKRIAKIDINNHYLLGFPTVSLVKNLEILINNFYVVVVIDQDINCPSKRNVSGIYSYGTYIDNIEHKDANYIVTILIKEEKQRNTIPILCLGMAGTDLSTGKSITCEFFSNDNKLICDEIYRFISNSKEINIVNPNKISNLLELDNTICRTFDSIDKKYSSIDYQNEILNTVFKNKSSISPIEFLNLEKQPYATIAFTFLLDIIKNKNKNLLLNIEKPKHFISNYHLILGNNAIEQLNLINSTDNTHFKSLFHTINKTSTALGERFLKNRLLSPLTNIEKLKQSYEFIDEMIKIYKPVEKILDTIKDIEKLSRKMGLRLLKPFELSILITSYKNVIELIKFLKTTYFNSLIVKENNLEYKLKIFINECKKIFNINELNKYSNFDIKTSIFNKKIYPDIDHLTSKINKCNFGIEKLRKTLMKYIGIKKGITVKKNNRDGYYLNISNQRALKLKKIIKTKKISKFLNFKDYGKTSKIYFNALNENPDNLKKYNTQLEILLKKYYKQKQNYLFNKYKELFKIINILVTQIDFYKSNAKVAKLYNYVKPTIIDKNYGFIDVIELRHPIVERLIDHEYIPHSLTLGKNIKGMLIYGFNSSGKSVLMKALGLSIIIAQSGMFVPAKKFTFSPYSSLFTRITGNDDIYRGLSSFSLEMIELNTILKHSNKKTLIIGDEICRGTENLSATSIVASAVIELSHKNTSFIIATHLHDLNKINDINNLSNVKSFHLSVSYDTKNDTLIYDRKLKIGSGDSFYGILVAQYIIHDINFIDSANKIKNLLMGLKEIKKSRYNSKIYMTECHICGSNQNLETHHINKQKDCYNNFVINKKHIPINSKCNLVVLCSKCHDNVHKNNIKLTK